MTDTSKTEVSKDFNKKTIVVSREFDAPVEKLWQAHTDSAFLDKWWGPSPWRAETKHMDFRPGGYWLYAMVGPDGQRHWSRMNYMSIDTYKSIEIEDEFCDEEGKLDAAFPVSRSKFVFTKTNNGTRVDFELVYTTEADLEKIIDMGFEQGISICLDQLDELLKEYDNK